MQCEAAGMSVSPRPAQARFLDVLSHVSQIVSSGRSLDTILCATVNLIKTMLDVERCSILILDPVEQVLRLKAASSINPDEWDKVRVPLGHGIAGKVALEGRSILVENVDESPFQGMSPRGRYSTSSFICVPLLVKGKAIGVINVNNRTDSHRFGRDDLDLITGLAGLIALTIDNARLISASETMRSHLEKIVENLPLGLIAVDLNKRATLCNRRMLELFGTPYEAAARGQSLDELLPMSVRTLIRDMLEETANYGVDLCREADIPSPFAPEFPESFLPLEICTSPLNNSSGETNGILITFQDLSMRREIDELRRLDEMKSNFLSMVSHELRTPLTCIKGAVHLLMTPRQQPEDSQQRKLLDIVDGNTERLTRLVNDLLDIVQIEDRAMVLNRHDENLADLVGSCIEGYGKAAEAKQIEFVTALDPVCASVDRHRLSQAIGQLLDNAIKFTPKRGTIRVSLAQDEEHARLSIRDSGPGIPKEARQKIFTKFFQVQNPMTRTVGGTGIGLYLTKSIVLFHGGNISISDGTSDGAEFVIELPLKHSAEVTVV